MKNIVRLMLCFIISFTIIESQNSQHAHAEMIPTKVVLDDMIRAKHIVKINHFLDRTESEEKLIELGINAKEAKIRVASLSDEELGRLSREIDKSAAGGQVIGILTIALLVILIIYFAKRI